MNILGISCYYHDSAAALIQDGKIVAAAQEERFTRKKHDYNFPSKAINYCLSAGSLRPEEIDYVVFYEKPFLKFERILETYLDTAPFGFNNFRHSLPVWVKEKLFQKSEIIKALKSIGFEGIDSSKILFSEHHLSHAASAFYPSPYSEALVVTLDGVGEWATTTVAKGQGHELKILKEIHFPHSLGLLYSAFTYFTGFKVNSGEYKVMGLAPYGEPRFKDLILQKLIQVKADGSFKLNLEYFSFQTGDRMTNKKFADLFGIPVRKSESPLLQIHMDLAASIQAVTEEVLLKMVKALSKEYPMKNLCLAGGVALNCVANGKILKEKCFENIWIQPAAGDAGGALGAALYVYYSKQGLAPSKDGEHDLMNGAYLGSNYTTQEAAKKLSTVGAKFEQLNDSDLVQQVVKDLIEGRAIGWMRGRMEFGPRALGARSILADPRNTTMQKNLNLKVKFRESFRPFAPMVLREDLSQWFELDVDSPYMLLVANIVSNRRLLMSESESKLFGIDKLNVKRSEIPAVTHVDYSARLQTVHKQTNPFLHSVLTEFKRQTGCPILVNTSFNVRGEPIVESPEDAFRCFMGTDIESLFVENNYLRKENQDAQLKLDYKDRFEMD